MSFFSKSNDNGNRPSFFGSASRSSEEKDEMTFKLPANTTSEFGKSIEKNVADAVSGQTTKMQDLDHSRRDNVIEVTKTHAASQFVDENKEKRQRFVKNSEITSDNALKERLHSIQERVSPSFKSFCEKNAKKKLNLTNFEMQTDKLVAKRGKVSDAENDTRAKSEVPPSEEVVVQKSTPLESADTSLPPSSKSDYANNIVELNLHDSDSAMSMPPPTTYCNVNLNRGNQENKKSFSVPPFQYLEPFNKILLQSNRCISHSETAITSIVWNDNKLCEEISQKLYELDQTIGNSRKLLAKVDDLLVTEISKELTIAISRAIQQDESSDIIIELSKANEKNIILREKLRKIKV